MRTLLRVIVLAASLAPSLTSHAQPTTLADVASATCTPEAAGLALDTVEPNAFVVSVLGNVFAYPAVTPAEDERVRFYVVGPSAALLVLRIVRTSPTRDPDVVRLIGEGFSAAELGITSEEGFRADMACAYTTYELGDFSPPEGRAEMEILTTDGWKDVAVLSFAVRRVFQGAISFGPLVSTLPDVEYSVVPVDPAAADPDSVLAVEGENVDLHYAIAFTYYLGGGRTRDGSLRYGLFAGMPVRDPLKNAFAGVSLDLGGLFLAHVGARLGKVERLAGQIELEEGESVTRDPSELETEEVWKAGFAFGVTLDANAAAKAFGSVLKGVSGAR